jgi:hypothetical protein
MKGKGKGFDEWIDRGVYVIQIIVKVKGGRKVRKVYAATGKMIEISDSEDKY